MIKVGIYGASGYTGQELLKILVRHPEAEVVALTSRKYTGMPVSDVYPAFTGLTKQSYIDASADEVASRCDMVFLAVPHGQAMEVAPRFVQQGVKVVDLSADYRLRDVAVYEEWYRPHTSAEFLSQAIYGMPELYRSEIKDATLVANPGCYPTGAILGLAPALRGNVIDTASIIIDSKSGVSGAGREAQVGTLFCEVNEGFKAYKIGAHRHTPEIDQELSSLAGGEVSASFVPHLVPANRGILSTIYARLTADISYTDVLEMYQSFYGEEPFVRVYGDGMYPNIAYVKGSNYCDIGLVLDAKKRRVIIITAIDNLVKGAAGQAVQNMNLMCGFPEDMGLQLVSLFP